MNSLWISLSLFFHLSSKKFCKQCQDLPQKISTVQRKKRVNYKSRCWFCACFTSSLTQQETLQALMYLYSSVEEGNGNPLQYSCLEWVPLPKPYVLHKLPASIRIIWNKRLRGPQPRATWLVRKCPDHRVSCSGRRYRLLLKEKIIHLF